MNFSSEELTTSNLSQLQFRLDTLRDAYHHGVTPRQVYQEFRRRLAAWADPALFIHVAEEADLEPLLTRLESVPPTLPLYGIPFAIKDNIDWEVLPTTASCPAYAYHPSKSARVVERLIEAGAFPVGKTNLDQFAAGLVGTRSPYGTPRNARGPQWIPGGSSAGSASAVAAGLVAFALGTDTAGSGRVPAGFQELVGCKPTRGWLSNQGVVPAVRSLDCVSLFTNSVAEAQVLLKLLARHDPQDPWSREVLPRRTSLGPSLVLGVPKKSQWAFFGDHDYEKAYETVLEDWTRRGAQFKEFDFEPFRQAAKELYEGPWLAERRVVVRDLWPHPEVFHPITRKVLEGTRSFLPEEVFEAGYRLKEIQTYAESLWSQFDALVLPTAPTLPTLEEVAANPLALNTRLGYYTNFVNLLDLSALALPGKRTPEGRPFGFTLLGGAGADFQLLALGKIWETSQMPSWGESVLAVAGAHLRGMPLNYQLTERGGHFLQEARTAPHYQLFAFQDGQLLKPGVVRSSAPQSTSLEVELWDIPLAHWGSFTAQIPHPLGLGKLELSDGQWVTGFLLMPGYEGTLQDITHHGGWRKFLDRRNGTD